MRLSERNGDVGSGVLEVYRMKKRQWMPACVKNWDRAVSPSAVCSILGYSSVNATSVVTQRTHRPLLASVNVSTDIWKLYAKRRSTLMQEFANCRQSEDYPIAELTCSNFGELSDGFTFNIQANQSTRSHRVWQGQAWQAETLQADHWRRQGLSR